jgi:hypothetical protein
LKGNVKRMKRTILSVMIAVFVVNGVAYGKMEGIGLGVIAGEPTGLSIKKWIDERSAIDGALAWSFVDETSFQIHSDYLRHRFDFTEEFKGQLPFYYGIGARIKFKGNDKGNDDTKLGVRIPVGLTYIFQKKPIDLFMELVPILDITPKTDIKLNAAIGVRYYLK